MAFVLKHLISSTDLCLFGSQRVFSGIGCVCVCAQVYRLDQLSNENKKFQDDISNIFFCYLSAADFVFHNVG